jgi:hypothetical protein
MAATVSVSPPQETVSMIADLKFRGLLIHA